MDIPPFVLLPVDGDLGGYQFGAFMNSIAVNIRLQAVSRHTLSLLLGKQLEVEFSCMVGAYLTV